MPAVGRHHASTCGSYPHALVVFGTLGLSGRVDVRHVLGLRRLRQARWREPARKRPDNARGPPAFQPEGLSNQGVVEVVTTP